MKDYSTDKLSEKHFRTLMFISLVSIVLMVFHDLDHLRVNLERHYSTFFAQAIPVVTAYFPAIIAFIFAKRHSAYAALVSLLGGITVFIGLNLYHVIGLNALSPLFSMIMGVWNVPFSALHVDCVSWGDLAINMIWSIIVISVSLKLLCNQISVNQVLEK
jgi:hypothetical protein